MSCLIKSSPKQIANLSFLSCSSHQGWRFSDNRKLSSKAKQSPIDYCLNSVRKHDHENFLSLLLLPKTYRSDVFALRAFNVELAQVGSNTKETMAGLMRLQFWRETIDAIYADKPPRQPVALALDKTVKRCKLQKKWLKKLIKCREEQVESPGYRSLYQLEQYSEDSCSSLHYLTLQAAGISDLNTDHCAGHIGKAEGIVKVIRSIPYFASKRKVIIPTELLLSFNVSEENIIRQNSNDKMRDLVHDLASTAHNHLRHAYDLSEPLPREHLLPLLPYVALRSYLKRLQRTDFDVFDTMLNSRNTWLPLMLFQAKITRNLGNVRIKVL